ncbi:MAG TPA: VWA domain-containing protein [Patescibacteria group bacterium]|nr:VWA domain-containing protein [Patescibacteria group bacterium]
MGLFRARLLRSAFAAAAAAATAATIALTTPATGGRAAESGTAGAAGPVTVRFAEPASSTLLQGPTRVTIEAATSADARIVSVTLYADDALLTVMERPPYTVTWDAGHGAGVRRLRAVALDSAGRSGEAALDVRRVQVGQYEEVRLVNVYASVRDDRGRAVVDLGRDDFAVTEDGVPQTLTHFSSARVPITIALLIDASASMRLQGRIEMARKGAEEFVDEIEPEDRLLVFSFDDTLHGDATPLTDRKAIRERIRSITPGGGTALYDSVYAVAGMLQSVEGRRAMVLLSDGRDQALVENEPGSLRLFEEALERAHRVEMAIYAIGLGGHLDRELDLAQSRSLKEILGTLARQTGGRSWFPSRVSDLGDVYRQVADDLKRQYTLAYASTNTRRDGRWRSLRVTVGKPGLVVRAREGYYAPGPGAP